MAVALLNNLRTGLGHIGFPAAARDALMLNIHGSAGFLGHETRDWFVIEA